MDDLVLRTVRNRVAHRKLKQAIDDIAANLDSKPRLTAHEKRQIEINTWVDKEIAEIERNRVAH